MGSLRQPGHSVGTRREQRERAIAVLGGEKLIKPLTGRHGAGVCDDGDADAVIPQLLKQSPGDLRTDIEERLGQVLRVKEG